MRRRELEGALLRHVGALPATTGFDRYDVWKTLFVELGGEVAHVELLRSLRGRFVTEGDAAAARGLPHGLAHLFYQVKGRLRPRLLGQGVLGRATA